MKIEHEIKKIVLDGNLKPTATVEFNLGTHKDLEDFKKKLQDFVLDLQGQKKLKN